MVPTYRVVRRRSLFNPLHVDRRQQPRCPASIPHRRHRIDGFFPTIGAWVNYGLGSLNENLPQFVVMGTPIADCCGGMEAHRANYLGPQFDGVPLELDPLNPLPYAKPPRGIYREEQAAEFALIDH